MAHKFDDATMILYRLNELVHADYSTAEDETGNYDLSQPTPAYQPVVQGGPGPSGDSCRWFDGGDIMSCPGDSAAATALLGACTVEAWVLRMNSSAAPSYLVAYGDPSLETEAMNYLLGCLIDTSGYMAVFWEYGAGVNVSHTAVSSIVPEGQWTHVAWSVDSFSITYTEFDGSNEYVVLGRTLSLERTDAFSFSFWVRTSSSSTMAIMDKIVPSPSYRGWDVILTSGKVRLQLINNDATSNALVVESTTTIHDGAWHHVAVTYDGSSTAAGVTMYLDGAAVVTSTTKDGLTASIQCYANCQIGCREPNTLDFAGSLSNVMIYDVELSAANVETLYNDGEPNTSPPLTSNIIAWWKMGEGDTYPTLLDGGNGFVSNFPIYIDESTNSNDFLMIDMSGDAVLADSPGGSFSTKSTQFSGSNYGRAGNVLGFEYTDEFSISMWLKDTGSSGYLIAKADAEVRGWGIGQSVTGKYVFYMLGSGAQQLAVGMLSAISVSSWHHLVVTYDGSNTPAGVTIYIDGSSVATTTIQNDLASTIINSAELNLCSRTNGSSRGTAKMDEVAIYDKELSGSEVADIYNSGAPNDLSLLSSASNLVGWWRMGDSEIDTTHDGTMTGMESGDIQTRAVRNVSYYVNGVLKEMSGPLDGATGGTSSYWDVGGSGTSLFQGGLAEIHVSKVARSSSYILNDATSSTRRHQLDSDTLALWHLDEVTPEVYDACASGLHLSAASIGSPPYIVNPIVKIGVKARALSSSRRLIGVQRWDATFHQNLLDEYTIEFWAKIPDGNSSDETFIGFAGSGESYGTNTLVRLGLVWSSRTLEFLWETGSSGSDSTWSSGALWTPGWETGDYEVHHIAFVRKPNPATPFSRRAMRFIASGEYVEMGDVLGFDRLEPFSVSAWFKSDTTAGTLVVLVSKMGNSPDYRGWQLALSSGAVLFELRSASGNTLQIDTDATGYRDGVWHNVVVTYDGSSAASGVTIYVDGSSAASTPISDTLSATTVSSAAFRVGARSSAGSVSTFSGVIDEVAIYDSELSSSDVVAIYNGGLPNDLSSLGSSSSLVGWWRMGDGDVSPTILDHSSSGYDGEIGGLTACNRNIVGEVPGVTATVEVYVDGNYVDGTTGLTLPEGGWEGSWYVGASTANLFRMDDIRISNRARTAAEILESYNDGFVDFEKGLYFKMRAQKSPSGYVTWISQAFPDFDGDYAPEAIQAGTAVVAVKWEASPP